MAHFTGGVSPIILAFPLPTLHSPHSRSVCFRKDNERPSMVLPSAGVTGEFEHRDRSVLSVGASQGPVSFLTRIASFSLEGSCDELHP
jgi:hypothetical protein